MIVHFMIFNFGVYLVCFAGLYYGFNIPPVIPNSVILNNQYLVIYGSNITKSSDAQFVNVYDLAAGSIKGALQDAYQEKYSQAPTSYQPTFIPNANTNATMGYLNYGVENSQMKSDSKLVPSQNLLVPIRPDNKKVEFNLPSGNLENFIKKRPDNFPQQGYSIVSTSDSEGQILYIFGGIAFSTKLNRPVLSRAFFKYSVSKGTWEDLSSAKFTDSQNKYPPYSAFHSCVLNSDKTAMYCLGGMAQDSSKSENVLNESTESNIPNQPNIPFNWIISYRFEEKEWIETGASSSECAGSIIGHSTIFISNNIYVIGGIDKLGNDNPRFLPFCRFSIEGRSWKPIALPDANPSVLDVAFHTSQVINNNYLLIGYGYHSTTNNAGSLIGIDMDKWEVTDHIPSIKASIQAPSGSDSTNPSPLSSLYIILITIGATLIFIGLVVFLLYKYKFKNRLLKLSNRSASPPSNARTKVQCQLFDSPPSNHLAMLWSDSPMGKLGSPAAMYAHQGRNSGSCEMFLPTASSDNSTYEFEHLPHFQHQPTIPQVSEYFPELNPGSDLQQSTSMLTQSPPPFYSDSTIPKDRYTRISASSITLNDKSQQHRDQQQPNK